MNWTRIKTILIFMMLAVDFFLGAIFFVRWADEKAVRDSARRDLIQVMDRLDVEIYPGVIPEGVEGMKVFRAETDLAAELRSISAVLGDTAAEDQGASTLLYRGAAGWARKRPGGALELEIEDPVNIPDGVGKKSEMVRLFGAMGIAGETGAMNAETAEISQFVGGSPLFNCSLKLSYGKDGLKGINGKWIFPRFEETGDRAAQTAEGCLLELVKSLRAQGRPCGAIYMAESGYFAQQFGQVITAWPVIRVRCDTGEFYWNTITSDIMEIF